MFDLEQSIAEWRKQMLAAGIQSPEPLEELEVHLREEIERQTHLGINAQTAFDLAVQKIGHADLLKTEFKKAAGFSKWLSGNETAPVLRILGLLWLIISGNGSFNIIRLVADEIREPDLPTMSNVGVSLFLWLLLGFVYLFGVWAGILLFKGNLRERRFLRFLAGIFAIGGIAAMVAGHPSFLTFPFTVFGFVSIWLLRPPQKTKLANT
jgi:hypothetical protein